MLGRVGVDAPARPLGFSGLQTRSEQSPRRNNGVVLTQPRLDIRDAVAVAVARAQVGQALVLLLDPTARDEQVLDGLLWRAPRLAAGVLEPGRARVA